MRGESRRTSSVATALAGAGLAVALFVCGVLVTADTSGVRVEGPVTRTTTSPR
ncbi:hypothetical protein [Streptomyces sp. NPDC048638]|uniref:hypothetical protein n=1 Tax=Streptomyces sp. NPDC048638 TaxID=3365580 RepID=UPI0037114169